MPPAPEFVGREAELDDLGADWSGGAGGVVALVGLGGAGKTALAARFLGELLEGRHGAPPLGLFVWSFYQQPDPGRFLEEAFRYFAGKDAAASPARGAGLLHLLREALSSGRPHLVVLDGLERVQTAGGEGAGDHGRVEDPLLRGFLSRVAEGAGRTSALVTSRFPLTDLEPYRGRGYRPFDVGGLGRDAAVDLLRRRGVRGDDDALAGLVASYGAHALTLDHLGGLIGQFLGGDPTRAPEAPALAGVTGDRQALRLGRLLRAYEEHLPPAELSLLCRLCLLQGSVAEGQVLRLFHCSPEVHAGAAREAADLLARIADKASLGPLDLAELALAAIEEALAQAPLAGPAGDFAGELGQAVVEAIEAHQASDGDELDRFLRLYAGASLDDPTDERPLPANDRECLPELARMYRSLREHPLAPSPQTAPESLKEAMLKQGWLPPGCVAPDDLGPADIASGIRFAELHLSWFFLRHVALARVREVCRTRQRKWALAGPLAPLDADAIRRVLAALVDRHLVVREGDGSISVHPAVRDHFGRLGDPAGREGWHDLIREQLVSLVRRPGRGLPDDKATLDLVEEAIHHALEAGRLDEAWALYEQGLGGLRHLGWKLGEMARGWRVLRRFRPCPDPSALAWFLRALGELDAAYLANAMPYFRADVRLLQGRLPEVAAEGDPARAATAAWLMGDRAGALPPDLLGLTIPRVQLLLLAGRIPQAAQGPWPDRLYGEIGWEGDRVRLLLLRAEVARRQADLDGCRRALDAASAWVLRSGSVEHLGLWHLVRARSARDAGDLAEARRALAEGVHLASRCGLGLYHVLLRNAEAETLLRVDPEAGEAAAREALGIASDGRCRFGWGASDAGHLLGQALTAQWRYAEARAAFVETIALRDRIGDPGADQTRRLLARLPS